MKKHRAWALSAHQLEARATALLRGERAVDPSIKGAMVVDLLNSRDAERRELRRKEILSRNTEAARAYLSNRNVPTPEDQLIRAERAALATIALKAIFTHFEREVAVKRVLIATARGVPFSSTKQLMEVCDLTCAEVMSAKKKIRYFANSAKADTFEKFLTTFKGGE